MLRRVGTERLTACGSLSPPGRLGGDSRASSRSRRDHTGGSDLGRRATSAFPARAACKGWNHRTRVGRRLSCALTGASTKECAVLTARPDIKAICNGGMGFHQGGPAAGPPLRPKRDPDTPNLPCLCSLDHNEHGTWYKVAASARKRPQPRQAAEAVLPLL